MVLNPRDCFDPWRLLSLLQTLKILFLLKCEYIHYRPSQPIQKSSISQSFWKTEHYSWWQKTELRWEQQWKHQEEAVLQWGRYGYQIMCSGHSAECMFLGFPLKCMRQKLNPKVKGLGNEEIMKTELSRNRISTFQSSPQRIPCHFTIKHALKRDVWSALLASSLHWLCPSLVIIKNEKTSVQILRAPQYVLLCITIETVKIDPFHLLCNANIYHEIL